VNQKSNSFIPQGWPSVIPRLSTADPGKMVDFIKDVFGASGSFNDDRRRHSLVPIRASIAAENKWLKDSQLAQRLKL